jgi:hypothetical protein
VLPSAICLASFCTSRFRDEDKLLVFLCRIYSRRLCLNQGLARPVTFRPLGFVRPDVLTGYFIENIPPLDLMLRCNDSPYPQPHGNSIDEHSHRSQANQESRLFSPNTLVGNPNHDVCIIMIIPDEHLNVTYTRP